jgi:hypothetical protein
VNLALWRAARFIVVDVETECGLIAHAPGSAVLHGSLHVRSVRKGHSVLSG